MSNSIFSILDANISTEKGMSAVKPTDRYCYEL